MTSHSTAMKLYIVTPNTFKPADDMVWSTSLKMEAWDQRRHFSTWLKCKTRTQHHGLLVYYGAILWAKPCHRKGIYDQKSVLRGHRDLEIRTTALKRSLAERWAKCEWTSSSWSWHVALTRTGRSTRTTHKMLRGTDWETTKLFKTLPSTWVQTFIWLLLSIFINIDGSLTKKKWNITLLPVFVLVTMN